MDIRYLDSLHASVLQAKRLAYTGMHLIHPTHVPVINEVFTPTAEEAEWQVLIEAMEERQIQRGRYLRLRHGGYRHDKRQPAPCWQGAPDIQSPNTKGTPDTNAPNSCNSVSRRWSSDQVGRGTLQVHRFQAHPCQVLVPLTAGIASDPDPS